MTATLYLIKPIDIRKNSNEHRILYENFILITNWMRKRKQPITDRFWSCSKHSGYALEFLNLIKHCCSSFKHYFQKSGLDCMRTSKLYTIGFQSSCHLTLRAFLFFFGVHMKPQFEATFHEWVVHCVVLNTF